MGIYSTGDLTNSNSGRGSVAGPSGVPLIIIHLFQGVIIWAFLSFLKIGTPQIQWFQTENSSCWMIIEVLGPLFLRTHILKRH